MAMLEAARGLEDQSVNEDEESKMVESFSARPNRDRRLEERVTSSTCQSARIFISVYFHAYSAHALTTFPSFSFSSPLSAPMLSQSES